jgi:hypothetical protein
MTFAQRKFLVLASWVATIMTVGVLLTLDKPELWVVIASLAIIPAAIGHWLWEAPEPTLSELVAKGRSRS